MTIEEVEINGETGILRDLDDLTAEQFASKPGPKPKTDEQRVQAAAKKEADGELNRLFSDLRAKISEGHAFTDAQMDIAVSILFTRLEKADVVWIKEMSESVASRPIWQLFAGWFKLLHERGETTGAIYDVGWEQNDPEKKEKSQCKQCYEPFVAERPGQEFCNSVCGALNEKEQRQKAQN